MVSNQQQQTDQLQSTAPENATDPSFQLAVITAFVLVNLAAPLFVGEVYPFTNSPIFRDEPEKYTVYEVFDDQGRPLPPENYGLQLEYNGNPPGLGVGFLPRDSINQFGKVESEAMVRSKVQRRLKETSRDELIVHQQVIGAIDNQHVGLIEDHRWTIKKN